jgi:hypothetical protein
MYGGDGRSVCECMFGKLKAEGGFVWSMTLALIQRVYNNLRLQGMHTSVQNVIYTYSRLQRVSAKYMVIIKGRKCKHEIHKTVKRNRKII